MRRKLLIGASVLAACAFAGGAYAASSDTSPKQAFLNDVAKRLHVTPQQLKSALEGATQDQLNAAVRAGKLTQAQANAIEKRLSEGAPALPFLGPGLVRPVRPGLLRRAPIFGLGPLAAAAQYLGLSPVQLLNQLSSGKSLAQIATAHGKSVSGLENAMVAAERSRLDRARQKGLISSSQEKRLLSRIQAKISAVVNHAGFRLRFGPLGRPRFGPLAGPPPVPFFGPRLVPPVGAPPAAPLRLS